MIVAVIIGVIVILALVWHRKKSLRHGNLTLVTGGVKTGKTELCVALSVKRYKKHLREWRWKCRLAKLFKKPIPEKPLYYSNMPVGRGKFAYVPLTVDLLKRERRFAYKSVVYFNEVSLLAGSKDIKDEAINDQLLHLFKLCAHETRGGYFYIDTQSPMDMHYTIKRSLSTYFNIVKRATLPLVSVLWVRENILVDGENTVAIDTQIDPQDNVMEGGKPLYFVLLPNRWWKWYDRYAYSALTDHLEPVTKTKTTKDTKKVYRVERLKK